MTDLLRLAERCEQAAGPDRALDCAISLALVEPPNGCRAVPSELSSQAGLIVDRVGRLHGTVDYQPFTASLDAAMTLVPEESDFGVREYSGSPPSLAQVWLADGSSEIAHAPTAALALCSAALKARASQ